MTFLTSSDDPALCQVFADDVYADCDLHTVRTQDAAFAARTDSARVYDGTFVRHWDIWCGPKRAALFFVRITPVHVDSGWALGADYVCPMKGTGHVGTPFSMWEWTTLMSSQACPVYPFGGTDDFALSATHVVYSSRDPTLPAAFHTRRNVEYRHLWHSSEG
jgi:hypothetical protein